ncbi:MAG: hypothetical protein Q8N83_10525 [Ignavibacteria bacterium]|nr:hypothetical protein [Ignavibacteria bacterium]
MAKSVRKKGNIKVSKVLSSPFNIYWSKTNYIVLALGLLSAILGYYFLSVKPWNSSVSLYLAPVILVLVYIVFFPLSILIKKKEPTEQESK